MKYKIENLDREAYLKHLREYETDWDALGRALEKHPVDPGTKGEAALAIIFDIIGLIALIFLMTSSYTLFLAVFFGFLWVCWTIILIVCLKGMTTKNKR